MKNKIKFSLKNKVVLTNISVVVFFAIGLVFLLSRLMVSALTDLKRETASAVLQGQAREIEFALSRPAVTVKELAKSEPVVTYFSNKNKIKDVELLDFFKYISVGREYSNVYLMDDNGDVVVSVDPTFLKNNFAFRDYYREAMAGRTHVQIAFGVLTHKPGYYFSAPVILDGVSVGVVVIKMDTSYINNMFIDTPTKTIGHYFLTEENGVVVSSDKEIGEYQSLGVIPEEKKKKLVEERRFEGFGMKPLQYQLAQDAIEKYKEPVTFDYMDTEDNENELLQVYKIGDYPFYLVTETGLESIFDKIKDILWPIAYLMGGGVIVGIIFQYLIFAKIFNPLAKLEKFTKEVSEGEGDKTFEIKTGDELESLAKSVKQMVVAVEGNKDELEKGIAERTKELEQVKDSLEEKVKTRTEELENLKSALEVTVADRTAELKLKLDAMEKMQQLIVGREQKMIDLKNEIESLKNTK